VSREPATERRSTSYFVLEELEFDRPHRAEEHFVFDVPLDQCDRFIGRHGALLPPVSCLEKAGSLPATAATSSRADRCRGPANARLRRQLQEFG
jgi:hypothetical protein